MLDNRYAILFIRGELPVMDLKFDLMRHPSIHGITDGGSPVFDHGNTYRDTVTVELVGKSNTAPEKEKPKTAQTTKPKIVPELLSEYDLETKFFEVKEITDYEKQEKIYSLQAPVARWH